MNLQPFYRRPGFRTVLGLLLWGLAYMVMVRLSGADRTGSTYLIDLGLAVFTLVGIIALTAQFVLPVHKLDERGAVIQRLFDYLMGARGPVMFIRSGRSVEGAGERQRAGSGVLLIDHASAGVLRTDTHFTRAIGPGVTFSQAGERLAEALDLRMQTRRIPASRPDDPEAASQPGSLALTEDGIPISADLAIWFMLDPGHTSTPRLGQFSNLPPFEFNPRSAERAVFGHAYRESADAPWSELPTLILVDLWREEVKQWRLESLLGEDDGASNSLDSICENLHKRLVNTGDTASPAGRELELLKARGIRVLDVRVSGLQVPQAVQLEHLRRWRERWSSNVEDNLSEGRQHAGHARQEGERRAFGALDLGTHPVTARRAGAVGDALAARKPGVGPRRCARTGPGARAGARFE